LHVHLLRTQARASSKGPPKKLLRSLAGLGGVSDATLAKQLAWIREHPEVLFATCISILAHSDEATLAPHSYIYPPTLCPFLFRLACQVLDASVGREWIGKATRSDVTIGSERIELADGTTDDFVSITLYDALDDLCRRSPNFLQALRDMAVESGPRLHAYACIAATLN
jgi:hypothetical protein